jgi:flagellar assembly factor FliW
MAQDVSVEVTRTTTAVVGQGRPKTKDAIYFPEGLLGFEEVRVLKHAAWDDFAPLEFLISTDGPSVTLPVIEPTLLLSEYDPRPTRDDLRVLKASGQEDLQTLCVVNTSNGQCYVNLRGPIFINWSNQLGRQRVLAESRFKVSHRLTSSFELEDAPSLGR